MLNYKEIKDIIENKFKITDDDDFHKNTKKETPEFIPWVGDVYRNDFNFSFTLTRDK